MTFFGFSNPVLRFCLTRSIVLRTPTVGIEIESISSDSDATFSPIVKRTLAAKQMITAGMHQGHHFS